MFKSTLSLSIYLVVALVVFTGCSADEDVVTIKNGKVMNQRSPEYAALKFFEHIYNDPTITAALPYCSQSLQKTIKRYHSNKNVQRHVLNLSYDNVDIEVHSGESRFEQISGKRSTVILHFSGFLHGDKIDDIKKVELSNNNDRWMIQRISAYPY